MGRAIFGKSSLSIALLFLLFLVVLESGCVGVQRSNLTVAMPESTETSFGKPEVLKVELLPLEADASEVAINISVPPEISFVDSKTKEFKTLARDQKIIIPFNYSARSDGTFNLTIEIKASNANIIKRNFTVDAYVSAPKVEIGEFSMANYTKGMQLGLHVGEVIGKEIIDGKEYCVSKLTWEGEPNGTYILTYSSVDNLSTKRIEYYDNFIKDKIIEFDPPTADYGFPFKVGKKWSYSGFTTGLGKTEAEYEIVKKGSITVPIGTYTGYCIRSKATYSLGSGVGEMWYVPELGGSVKGSMIMNVLGITSEEETELLQIGEPPAKPPQIQQDLKIPLGYKIYKNDTLNFRIAYPANWRFVFQTSKYISTFYFMNGSIYTIYITVEDIGKLNLKEYREAWMSYYKRNFPELKISEEKSVTVNGREGFEWVYEYMNEKGKLVIFVAHGKGYVFGEFSYPAYYDMYKPIFDDMVKTFFIKGSPKYT